MLGESSAGSVPPENLMMQGVQNQNFMNDTLNFGKNEKFGGSQNIQPSSIHLGSVQTSRFDANTSG